MSSPRKLPKSNFDCTCSPIFLSHLRGWKFPRRPLRGEGLLFLLPWAKVGTISTLPPRPFTRKSSSSFEEANVSFSACWKLVSGLQKCTGERRTKWQWKKKKSSRGVQCLIFSLQKNKMCHQEAFFFWGGEKLPSFVHCSTVVINMLSKCYPYSQHWVNPQREREREKHGKGIEFVPNARILYFFLVSRSSC